MKMAAQKSCPSFGSVISVLSIVLYCGGFLRVELELNKQRKRIDALETDTQVKPSPKDPDITKIVMNSPELLGNGIHRNRRHVYRTKNETENKQTSDEGLKTDHLLLDLRLKLCQSNIGKCSAGPPGPPGPPGPRGEIGVRGRRGQKGRTGNKGNNGIMGSPGKSGKQGPKGEIGPEGQKGETGTKGTPGPKGNKGVMGSPGGSGKQGIMGLPGAIGKIGPKGQKGEIGTEGMPGAKGSKGVMGSPGRIGKQGIIGLLGPKGEPGPKGEKGVTGTQGMHGAKGSKGVMGSPGRSGKQGSMGLTGPKGETGPKGQKGGTGTTGILRSSSILNSLDSKYAFELNSFLGPVLRNPSRSMFVRCWRAKTDGWAATTFHRNCDAKGPTVTIIKVGSYIFGVYTDASWSSPSSCAHASSSKSFIYSLYNINGYAPVKLQVKSGGQSQAIYRCSSYGPTFGGAHDIYISNNAASNRNSYTFCGHSYPLPPGYSSSGYSCKFYAGGGSYKFTPTDVEVFYETTTSKETERFSSLFYFLFNQVTIFRVLWFNENVDTRPVCVLILQ